jgi:hypothetical protein
MTPRLSTLLSWSTQPGEILLLPGEPRQLAVRHLGAEAGGTAVAGARLFGRHQRHEHKWAHARHGGGQADGCALRDHSRHDRQCAVRCVRPAHRLHAVHAVDPVSRDPAGRREGPGQPAAGARCDLPAIGHRDHGAGAARRDGARLDPRRAAAGHASGPIPGGVDLVQPGAGCVAERGGGGHRRGGALAAERNEGKTPREAISRPACCASARS